MPKPINSTDEFFENLEKPGKVRHLNSLEDLKAIKEVNEAMEQVKRDFDSMNANSITSAKECYVFN